MASLDTPAAAAGPDRKWCQLGEGQGAFLLYVTTAADHDFSICQGGSDVDTDLDKVLSQSGWDRRCLSSNDAAAQLHAIVGVYSSSRRVDRAAAKVWCEQQGWTNNQRGCAPARRAMSWSASAFRAGSRRELRSARSTATTRYA